MHALAHLELLNRFRRSETWFYALYHFRVPRRVVEQRLDRLRLVSPCATPAGPLQRYGEYAPGADFKINIDAFILRLQKRTGSPWKPERLPLLTAVQDTVESVWQGRGWRHPSSISG